MSKKETDIARRVNVLKACMGLTVEKLSKELGISRATLNNAIKYDNPRKLNSSVMRLLEVLEAKHLLDKKSNDEPETAITTRIRENKEYQQATEKSWEDQTGRPSLRLGNTVSGYPTWLQFIQPEELLKKMMEKAKEIPNTNKGIDLLLQIRDVMEMLYEMQMREHEEVTKIPRPDRVVGGFSYLTNRDEPQ